MTIVERARLLMAGCPPAISGSGGHSATYRVAAALVHGYGLSPEEAFPLMMEFNAVCQPPWAEHEIWHKLRSALGGRHQQPRGHLLTGEAERGDLPDYSAPRRKEAIKFDPEALKKMQNPALKITDAWLRERSPIDPRRLTPGALIDGLYRPDDQVMIFTAMRSRGDFMRWRGRWYALGKSKDVKAVRIDKIPDGAREGMIFMVQPVDGKWHPKVGKPELSRRTLKSVVRYPYLLLESDEAPADQWLNAMVQLRIPIVCISRSAGRSIHALVRIDADTHDEWLNVVTVVRNHVAVIGCDRQALSNPAVNMRLGNTWREGKMLKDRETEQDKFLPFADGRRSQRCLYYNPTAAMKAIAEQPRYEHTTDEQ